MSSHSDNAREVTSETSVIQFQPQEIEVLREIIQTYRANRLDLFVGRPRFKRPRSNSGILLNNEIKKRASEKARADPEATGGSLSGLVELLLWRYIGSPSDVVERLDSNRQPREGRRGKH
jgi:hypothetical protein